MTYESDIPFLSLRALLRQEYIDWFTAFGFEGGDSPFLIGVIHEGRKGRVSVRSKQLEITAKCFIIGKELTLEEAVEFDEHENSLPFCFKQWGQRALTLRDLTSYEIFLKHRSIGDVDRSGRDYGVWKRKFNKRLKKAAISRNYFDIPNLFEK